MTDSKKVNPNTNCLANMACPKCGSFGSFKIFATRSGEVEVFDDGTDDLNGDTLWTNESACRCMECSHSATVADFTDKAVLEESEELARKTVILASCPFCGSSASHSIGQPYADVLDAVYCNEDKGSDCFACIKGTTEPFSAVARWNRRK